MDFQEKQKIAQVVSDFRLALETLDRYDHELLAYPKSTTTNAGERITYEEAMDAIAVLKELFNDSDIFGTEKDASFKSSLGQIYQTFDGKELYPTAEMPWAMKAAPAMWCRRITAARERERRSFVSKAREAIGI